MASSEEIVTTGGCFCGAARYQVKGRPVRAAYCHCTLCQRFNAAAFIHTIHWEPTAFSWTHSATPEDVLDFYHVAHKPWKKRYRCKTCGVAIANENTKTGKWSVWGAQLDRDEHARIRNWDVVKPTAHWFYETRMLDVDDALGKWAGYENESERLG
ncbi:hypothetical protein D9611_005944 [Ephemerocybe angulata]|uniref:CENP-V/GFA domain-containing protein n=1 Tax=Ephemerocybe angulata TaxID=980116 RepID=A0A8H5CGL9_9AGAR|nr:hypothetical protein D9611_005944 [Tulosesus angulatus]